MGENKIEDWMVEGLVKALTGHATCEKEQIGPCVYCVPHKQRLYQGTLAASVPVQEESERWEPQEESGR